MMNIAMIGFGAMANHVFAHLPDNVTLTHVIVRTNSIERVQNQLGDSVKVQDHAYDLENVDIVLEMAGQSGLKMHVFDVLNQGLDIAVISVGAFADAVFEVNVREAAKQNHCKVHLLSGSIAGIDGLSSAKIAGLNAVTYYGCKHPRSWQGSYAEELVELSGLTTATTFFKGTAREAAHYFPANANVAATIGLAGIGLDETQVELIADPAIHRNKHQIEACGAFGELSLTIQGMPLPDNPKTSMMAALSILNFCHRFSDSIRLN